MEITVHSLVKGPKGGHTGASNIVLEDVSNYDLWILHSFFGRVGSRNDTLQCSPVFARPAERQAPECEDDINGYQYNKGYYVADAIYPLWSTFVTKIRNHVGHKNLTSPREKRVVGRMCSGHLVCSKPVLLLSDTIVYHGR